MNEFFEFSNPNDLSRDEFESRKKFYGWNVYTPEQIAGYGVQVSNLIHKGMSNELSEAERSMVAVGKAELKDMQQIRIVENIDGRIVKSLVFIQDPQVKWVDTLEKSTDGKSIQKGIFMDTPLNRELNRVGKSFEKGCGKSSVSKEMIKAIKEKEEYGKAAEMFEKGMKDDESFGELKKAYPNVTEGDFKNFKKAYNRSFYEDLLEKASKLKAELDKDPDDKEE